MLVQSRHFLTHGFVVLCLMVGTGKVCGQHQIDFTTDIWIPNLPNYHAGSIVNQGVGTVVQNNIFEDNQTNAGMGFGLRGIRPIESSCWMLEYDANFAWSNPSVAQRTFADPGPTQTVWLAGLDGMNFLSTADGENVTFGLDSDVLHYSEYIGLRRSRFCTSRGRWDVGIGISHLAFEQDFALNAQFDNGTSGQYLENLDTDFFGGQIRSTFNSQLLGRPAYLDINVGLYGMQADYDGVSNLFNAGGGLFDQSRANASLTAFATTVDVMLRSEWSIQNVVVRPSIGFQYISHMPLIQHPQTIIGGTPVSFDTDQSLFFSAGLEIRLKGICTTASCWANPDLN